MSELGDFIRLAADKFLPTEHTGGCCLALRNCRDEIIADPNLTRLALVKMNAMGMNTDAFHFFEFEKGSERQSVRHAWMYFVAQMVDEGEV